MPLQEQTVTLPFTKGEETKLDPKLVVDGSLLALKNAHFAKQGTPQRRDAWVGLDGAELPTAPSGVVAYNDELLAVTGNVLYSYSPAEEAMLSRGKLSPCTVGKHEINRSSLYDDQVDAARLDGYVCYVWRENTVTSPTYTTSGIKTVVLDESTGAVVYGPSYLSATSTATSPRLCAVSATNPSDAAAFVLVWVEGNSLKGAAIALSTLTASSVSTLRTDFHNGGRGLDMISNDGGAIAVYATNNGTNSIHALLLRYALGTVATASGPVACATQAVLADADITSLALGAFSSATIGVYALASNGVRVGVWVASLSATASALSLGFTASRKSIPANINANSNITAVLNGSQMWVFSDDAGVLGAGGSTGTLDALSLSQLDSSGSLVALRTVLASASYNHGPCGPYIAGKPFVSGGIVYLPAYVGSVRVGDPNLQCMWVLLAMDLSQDRVATVAAKALYGTYGLWTVNNAAPYMTAPPSTLALSATSFVCPALERGQLAFSGGASLNVTPVGVASLSLDFAPLFSTARVGENQFFAGGCISQYDGHRTTEASFHLFPETITTSLVGAGSLTGTYHYCALYEWTDGNGQRHQSSPSPTVTVTPSAQNVSIQVPTLLLTSKPVTDVVIVIYRTASLGSTFYRVNTVDNPIPNTDGGAMTTAYVDSASDATITANEILYTTSGALENIGPDSCSAVVAHQGRLWMVGLEDESEFRYSQAVINNQGLQFSDELSDRIPRGSDGLSAIGVLDDKAVLYTPARKFVVFGQGPAVDGTQNGYSTPQLLPSPRGCVDQRSICNISSGQVYQSSRGLYLLNRGLGDEYIGSPIEGLISGNSVVGAVVLDEIQQARFVVQAPAGAIGAALGFPDLDLGVSGFVLAYDEQFKQWSHHQSDEGALFSAACVWNGEPTYAMATPTMAEPAGALGAAVGAPGVALSEAVYSYAIVRDASGSYKDFGTTYIPVALTTGWIRLADLSGFERVRRLVLNGSFGSDSEITISVALDYDDTVVYSTTLDSSAAIASWQVFQLRHHLARQKVQAVQFTFTDTPLSGTGRGCDFSGLSLELGVKKGLAKLGSAAST